MKPVDYEWSVEKLEDGDVSENYPQDSYKDCLEFCKENPEIDTSIVLIVNEFEYNMPDRSWAYVVDGKLPTHAIDSWKEETRKIPKKFHRELLKA